MILELRAFYGVQLNSICFTQVTSYFSHGCSNRNSPIAKGRMLFYGCSPRTNRVKSSSTGGRQTADDFILVARSDTSIGNTVTLDLLKVLTIYVHNNLYAFIHSTYIYYWTPLWPAILLSAAAGQGDHWMYPEFSTDDGRVSKELQGQRSQYLRQWWQNREQWAQQMLEAQFSKKGNWGTEWLTDSPSVTHCSGS